MNTDVPTPDEIELQEDIADIVARRGGPTESLENFLEALEPTMKED